MLKSNHCSFTFQITQSAYMNVCIGIADKEDRGGREGREGRGAIYYHGRYGKVIENGR